MGNEVRLIKDGGAKLDASIRGGIYTKSTTCNDGSLDTFQEDRRREALCEDDAAIRWLSSLNFLAKQKDTFISAA